jgi:hypothetical protein
MCTKSASRIISLQWGGLAAAAGWSDHRKLPHAKPGSDNRAAEDGVDSIVVFHISIS